MESKFYVPRRSFLAVCGSLLLPVPWLPTNSVGQILPFELTLRRDSDLATTLTLDDCITGKLFQGAGTLSDPGTFICDTLELPFRNELTDVSCIKPGSYSATVKTLPTAEGVALGWRLELDGTKQLAVQIHTGNTTKNTRGCILVGKRSATACELVGGTSVPARDTIKALYGGADRPVRVVVLN